MPRTRDALDVLCENVRIAQDALPVPLALENIAALFSWPDEELTEGSSCPSWSSGPAYGC